MKPILKSRRAGLLLITAFLCHVSPARSQEQAPVEFPDKEIASHRVGESRQIHIHPEIGAYFNSIMLQVIVSPSGTVESAKAIGGTPRFCAEAESVEAQRQFKPFEKDGVPVRASIKDYVAIYPLEQWSNTKIPFPEVKDWNSLRITLKEQGCIFEDCLSYSVEIRGDGSVTYTGGQHYPLITGVHHGKTSEIALINLVNEFRRADYLSLKNKYHSDWSDQSTTTSSIEFDGNSKQVIDYDGLRVGMPEVVRTVETAVVKAGNLEKWLKETDETWPSLLAEHWNFKAQTEENRALFARVAERGSSELIQNFLAAGAPGLELTKEGKGAIVSAAARGDAGLTAQMLAGQDHLSPELLFHALRAAAASGNLATVDLLLQRGADVNANPDDGDDRGTVLMAAARSGKLDVIEEILKYHPDIGKKDLAGRTALQHYVGQGKKSADTEQIIQELVAAGADVNTRDNQGENLLFSACYNIKTVKPLVHAGADLNTTNNNGFTAIMMCTRPDFINAMIDAGADLSAQNKYRQTAAQWYRSTGLKEQAEILETAMKAKQEK
jgi:ankyrin repeat protein